LIKKHNKWCRLPPTTPASLNSQFVPHLETQRPFHRRVNFKEIMRQLAALYNARQDSTEGTSEDDDQSSRRSSIDQLADDTILHSIQSSVTYWVHQDNQVETELFLLKHLTLQLPTHPLLTREIQRSTRTAYLDSSDWSVYSSLLPDGPIQSDHTVHFRSPQILWEGNSRNKDVVILIPNDNEYNSLRIKRKNLEAFLSTKPEELDLKSPEWMGNTSSSEDWIKAAKRIHYYIHSSSLHPSTFDIFY
jgi:SPX domain protein involved in polyphosphate accumulation